MVTKPMTKPKNRTLLRRKAAAAYRTGLRYLLWFIRHGQLAGGGAIQPLPYLFFAMKRCCSGSSRVWI